MIKIICDCGAIATFTADISPEAMAKLQKACEGQKPMWEPVHVTQEFEDMAKARDRLQVALKERDTQLAEMTKARDLCKADGDKALAELQKVREQLRFAQRDDWTASLIDRLNEFARENSVTFEEVNDGPGAARLIQQFHGSYNSLKARVLSFNEEANRLRKIPSRIEANELSELKTKLAIAEKEILMVRGKTPEYGEIQALQAKLENAENERAAFHDAAAGSLKERDMANAKANLAKAELNELVNNMYGLCARLITKP